MPFQVGNFKSNAGVDAKKAAIEAAKAASTESKAKALGIGTEAAAGAITKYIQPSECTDRIRIVFDDSGSMSGRIADAKTGVVEFLRNCIPNQTAVAVHFMNTSTWSTSLRSNLPELGADIQEAHLNSGGTPFFNTMKKALQATPKLTRLVAFTDGSPTDQLHAEESTELEHSGWGSSDSDRWKSSANVIITIAKSVGGDKCIPIDTVFFGSLDYSHRERELLQYLSDQTGGFFLHFDPSKPNIWKQLKYLAPVHRLQLMSPSFRASVEKEA